jgi:hypothetical protein
MRQFSAFPGERGAETGKHRFPPTQRRFPRRSRELATPSRHQPLERTDVVRADGSDEKTPGRRTPVGSLAAGSAGAFVGAESKASASPLVRRSESAPAARGFRQRAGRRLARNAAIWRGGCGRGSTPARWSSVRCCGGRLLSAGSGGGMRRAKARRPRLRKRAPTRRRGRSARCLPVRIRSPAPGGHGRGSVRSSCAGRRPAGCRTG